MNYSRITEYIYSKNIEELIKTYSNGSFNLEIHRAALKVCLCVLQNTLDEDEKSYFRMVSFHDRIDGNSYLELLSAISLDKWFISVVRESDEKNKGVFLRDILD